jgi:chromosomal replication initiator protein
VKIRKSLSGSGEFFRRRYLINGVVMKGQEASAGSQKTKEVSGTAFDSLRAALRKRFGETAYRRWLEPMTGEISREAEGPFSAALVLPTRFMRDWVEAHYGETIRSLLQEVAACSSVSFSVMSPLTKAAQVKSAIDSAPVSSISPLGRPPIVASSSSPSSATGLSGDLSADLDPRFTFDNFVVGKPNELAYAAARRVADTENPAFNPLFLYGGVGLGKTHLMHAIAWHIRNNYPHRRVIYMSAEKFMYQFVRALRFKDTVSFKEQFRSVDVLMIDDVQFIGGKDTTQEEFFHTFNALVDRNRQVIISADKSPQDLDCMEERLRSRLGWGLVADLHPVNYELRLGILHAKAEKLGCPVPDKVMEFLAHKIASNVRELEGALNRIVAHAQLVGRTISLEMTQEVLSDLLRASERRITIDEIQKKVAEHYNVRVADMHSARRARAVARPRQVAMYLAKQLTPRSLPEIGRKFGGRDHTTVIHAVRKIEELSAYDASFREDVELLRRLLQN